MSDPQPGVDPWANGQGPKRSAGPGEPVAARDRTLDLTKDYRPGVMPVRPAQLPTASLFDDRLPDMPPLSFQPETSGATRQRKGPSAPVLATGAVILTLTGIGIGIGVAVSQSHSHDSAGDTRGTTQDADGASRPAMPGQGQPSAATSWSVAPSAPATKPAVQQTTTVPTTTAPAPTPSANVTEAPDPSTIALPHRVIPLESPDVSPKSGQYLGLGLNQDRNPALFIFNPKLNVWRLATPKDGAYLKLEDSEGKHVLSIDNPSDWAVSDHTNAKWIDAVHADGSITSFRGSFIHRAGEGVRLYTGYDSWTNPVTRDSYEYPHGGELPLDDSRQSSLGLDAPHIVRQADKSGDILSYDTVLGATADKSVEADFRNGGKFALAG